MKKLLAVLMTVAVLTCFLAVPAFSAPKLVVKDSQGQNTVFDVEDTGYVGIGTATPQSQVYAVDSTGTNVQRGMVTAQHSNTTTAAVIQFKRSRGTEAAPLALSSGDNGGAFHSLLYDSANYLLTASIVFSVNGAVTAGSVPTDIVFYAGSNSNRPERMRLRSNGTLQMAGGAYTDGTNWYPASSKEYKSDIHQLSSETAFETLKGLNPVTFTYKTIPDQAHIGFIAEDVPDAVAVNDRKAIDPVNIIGVLTKVVQEQNKTIAELSEKLNKLEAQVTRIKSKDMLGSVDPSLISGN